MNEVYTATAEKLMDSYKKGYTKEFFGADWTQQDTHLVNRVQNNIFAFSGAKNYAQMRELRDAVYENGRLLPWDEYQNRALQVNANYNLTYLEAERSLVMAAGTAGSRWLDFEETKDTHPYLEYVTAGDERVREEHQLLNGIILPIDDLFWKLYYVPNGFGCRCSARKRTEREFQRRKRITGSDEAQKLAGKVVAKPFRHNVGTSEVFDRDGHPYFKANPDAKALQLSAVKNYGMKPTKDIYLDSRNLSGYKKNIRDKNSFLDYWKSLEEKYGKPGEGFTIIDRKNDISATFDRKFMDKVIERGRYDFFDEAQRILDNPDELWATFQPSNKFGTEFFNTYIKYYFDTPVVLLVDEDGRVDSMYKWERGLSDFEKFRTGLLKKRR